MIGRLGADAELKKGEQASFISMPVVEMTTSRDKKGQWVKATLTVKERDSSKLMQYLKKGKELYICGIPHFHAYQDKEGNPQVEVGLYVHELQLLGRKDSGDTERYS